VVDPARGLRGIAKLDVWRRAIEVERRCARLVDVSTVNDHAVVDELWFAGIPRQRLDTAVLGQPHTGRDHHHFALAEHRIAAGVEQRHWW